MKNKRAKKPTYHQMFDFLANKVGYKKMMELRDSQDPQAIEKAFQACSEQEAQA